MVCPADRRFQQKGCERAMRYAFEFARKRKKFGKKSRGHGHQLHEIQCTQLFDGIIWDSVYKKWRQNTGRKDRHGTGRRYNHVVCEEPRILRRDVPPIFLVISLPTSEHASRRDGVCRRRNINPERIYPSMFERFTAQPKLQKGIVNLLRLNRYE